MDINTIQEKLNVWRVANFGKPNANHQIMGIVEEVGELTHAKLKWDQGIRGYDEAKAKEEMKDAIGDMIIFAMGLCDVYDWKLQDIIDSTSSYVLTRDWKKNAFDGK
jgi:NTP pyrophosphatase (non-canonical NTP hydrolase)